MPRHPALLLLCLLLGPAALATGDQPVDVEMQIAARDVREHGITPGAERRVRWLSGRPVRTRLSLVYLHGYSATRQEVHPLPELIADATGANLFETRLTGHGRDGKAMLDGNTTAWKDDAREALDVGLLIGERVVVLSTSTGGTLSTWLATQARAQDIAALVMISPNFAPADKALFALDWPIAGPLLLAWLGDEERSWTPLNAAQSRYWTWHYPWPALVELARLLKDVERIDKATIRAPTLMIYSPGDKVVDPDAIRSAFAQWGAPRKRLLEYRRSGDPSQHVLAGDIVSPGSTAELASVITAFLREETAAGERRQSGSDGKSM